MMNVYYSDLDVEDNTYDSIDQIGQSAAVSSNNKS